MRAPAPKFVVRLCLFGFFLLPTSFAFANSITIGSLHWGAVVSAVLPATIVIDPPLDSPCQSAVFTMTPAIAGPLPLADGQLFVPRPTIKMLLPPPNRQTHLQPGQTFAIFLNEQPIAVPEPSSLLLFATGLLATAVLARRKMRR